MWLCAFPSDEDMRENRKIRRIKSRRLGGGKRGHTRTQTDTRTYVLVQPLDKRTLLSVFSCFWLASTPAVGRSKREQNQARQTDDAVLNKKRFSNCCLYFCSFYLIVAFVYILLFVRNVGQVQSKRGKGQTPHALQTIAARYLPFRRQPLLSFLLGFLGMSLSYFVRVRPNRDTSHSPILCRVCCARQTIFGAVLDDHGK